MANDVGPRPGDRVQVEARGWVVELERRGEVAGALVELDDDAGVLWLPADALVLLQPAPG